MSFLLKLQRLFFAGKGVASFAICVLTSLYLLSMPADGQYLFRQVMLATVFSPLEGIFTIRRDFYRVYEVNTMLRKQLAALQAQNDALRENREQNRRLRRMLDFKLSSIDPLIPGEVLGRGSGYYQTTWRINLGSRDSVSVNMPVLSNNGVLGKISKVYPTTSQLQLLTDPSSRISITNLRSREVGILESELHKLTALFPPQADIKNGDSIVTSGLGGVFPKGLMVGRILKKTHYRGDILTSWSIKPFENFNRVEEVFVMKRPASWMIEDVSDSI